MTFLPIVEREARTAARQPFLYGWRLVPIILAIWLLLPQYFYNSLAGNLKNAGSQCFSYLVWLMEFMAILAAWPACNGIATERREGTLGFIFLTDLKGIDVVLGKTTTFALGGFMVMLGLVPVLAITLLLGGVTGGEVARSAVAIVNTLLFSISLGLWSASRFADPMSVWKNIFRWMGVLVVLPLCLNIDAFKLVPFVLASPFGTLLSAADTMYSTNRSDYWLSLGIVQIESWVFFYLAHRAIGKTWRNGAGEAWKNMAMKRSSTVLGDKEPIAWLAARQPWQKHIIWTAVALTLFTNVWIILINSGLANFFIRSFIYRVLLPISHFGSILLLIWAVCRFFVESRRDGSMELLAVTPIGATALIQTYWLALQNQLRLPAILIVTSEFLRFLPMFITRGSIDYSQYVLFVVTSVMYAAIKLLSIYAICWVGMYTASTARTLWAAVTKTFCFMVLAPLLVQTLSVMIVSYLMRIGYRGSFQVVNSVGYLAVTLAIYGGGIFWARNKLLAMRPHETALNRLHVFNGLNRQWLNEKINAFRRWQAD